ncbi:MAG: hypothetical protein JW750_08915 [Anaerolineaceae bacterium]|nr:hypothetical protein [Anaerolineaceae bacterium]
MNWHPQTWFDDSEKRAVWTLPLGLASILFGLGSYLFILFYPVSALLAIFGLLMGYTSLDSARGVWALAGLVISGIGLLLPPAILMYLLFLA